MWRSIKDYEQYYEVSPDGQVQSLGGRRGSHGKILNQSTDNRGYKRVDLCVGNKRSTRQVHRLVADAYLNNPNNLPHINHLDGNPNNNNLINLEWTDHLGNMAHAWATGLNTHKGENHTQHKLTATEAIYIKEHTAMTVKQLASMFSISEGAVYDIWAGRTWRSV